MMITRWGFSDKLGKVAYSENQEEVFLGMSMGRTQAISEATAQIIDVEVRRLIDEGYNEATRILSDKKSDLEILAKGLLEYETLTGDEITDLLAGKPPVRESDDTPRPRSSLASAAGRKGKAKPKKSGGGSMEPQVQT